MKKNLIITILVLISLATTAFGIYQKQQASYYEGLAIRNQEVAESMAQEAKAHQKRAEEQAMIAQKVMQLAMENEARAHEAATRKK